MLVLVLPLAHARADDGEVPAARPRARRREARRTAKPAGLFARLQRGFEQRFERFRASYRRLLEAAIARPGRFAAALSGRLRRLRGVLLPWLGRDFFPAVDSGQIKLHVRGADGNAHRGDRAALRRDRRLDPPRRSRRDELDTIIDNIGVPYSGIEPLLQQLGPDRARRRRHPGLHEGEAPADRRDVTRLLRDRLTPRVSRRHVLLPAGRHGQPDPQLRPARADRRPDRRQRPGRQPRVRREAARPDPAHSRAPWTCASSSRSTLPGSSWTWTARGRSRSATRSATSPATCSSP